MRALTLTQPWAGLVASSVKLIENRPRLMIKREDFGKPFAIHASRQIDEKTYDRIREIAPEIFDYDYDNLPDNELAAKYPAWWHRSRVTSAIIGIATVERAVIEWHDGRIVDAHGKDGKPEVDLGEQRRWFFGPIGYVLRDVRALAQPIPCSGRQGFWTIPGWESDMIEEQLGAVG